MSSNSSCPRGQVSDERAAQERTPSATRGRRSGWPPPNAADEPAKNPGSVGVPARASLVSQAPGHGRRVGYGVGLGDPSGEAPSLFGGPAGIAASPTSSDRGAPRGARAH